MREVYRFAMSTPAIVSVDLKLTRCAAPPRAADSVEDTPRKPKSTSLKSSSSCEQPVSVRASEMIFFCARDCVATVIGYQTCPQTRQHETLVFPTRISNSYFHSYRLALSYTHQHPNIQHRKAKGTKHQTTRHQPPDTRHQTCVRMVSR